MCKQSATSLSVCVCVCVCRGCDRRDSCARMCVGDCRQVGHWSMHSSYTLTLTHTYTHTYTCIYNIT